MQKPDFPMALDSTMFAAYRSCPHQYDNAYRHHWKPIGESVDLVAGKAFAAGIEVVRKSFHDDHLEPEECLQKGVIELVREWGDFEAPEGHNKQLDRMIGALDEYFKQYGFQTDHIQPLIQDGKSAVEFSFALPIPDTQHPVTGEPILYSGRFDMLGLYNGSLFVVDEKTTKQLGATWNKNWTMRSQITAYCWAAREFGYPVAGAIIRGISILKTKYGHAESLQYRPDIFIDKWLIQVQRDVKHMIANWEEDYWDYNLDSSCTGYGGCKFQEACSVADEQKILERDFVRRVWDPLAREEVAYVAPPENT